MDAVAETIQERRNTLIETQEMIAILALVIVAVFVIVVGFDCIKDGMCDIGAAMMSWITAPICFSRCACFSSFCEVGMMMTISAAPSA